MTRVNTTKRADTHLKERKMTKRRLLQKRRILNFFNKAVKRGRDENHLNYSVFFIIQFLYKIAELLNGAFRLVLSRNFV